VQGKKGGIAVHANNSGISSLAANLAHLLPSREKPWERGCLAALSLLLIIAVA